MDNVSESQEEILLLRPL